MWIEAPTCVLDFETRSEIDLALVGAIEYAKHESTSIFCVGYKVEDGPCLLWIPERAPMPEDIWECFKRGKLVAQNASFERAITRYTLPRYPLLTQEQREHLVSLTEASWRCTAAKAAACSLPRSLEMAARALELPTQKDMVGSKLIKKYSKPRKPTKNNPKTWWDNRKELRDIYRYCLVDVQAEYELDQALPDLTSYEQRVWELDQRINDRGILIDIPTVKLILKMIHEETANIVKKVRELSHGTIESATQTARVLAWVNARGAEMTNLQAQTIAEKLLDPDLSPEVRAMLEYRQGASKTSTAKYLKMTQAVGADHRARELLLYHGASPTARWSGKRVQPQNFPRPTIKDFNSDEAIALIQSGGLTAIRKKYGAGNVMAVLVSSIRGMLIASPGCELFCADFAAVEARLAFWVAEHEEGLKAYRENRKLYEEMASLAFGIPIEEVKKESLERFVGKESVLGCLAKGTPILTQNGFKPIENITTQDLLWDGEKWVGHQGVLQRGLKPVIKIGVENLEMTPDHRILTLAGWRTSTEIASNPHILHQKMGSQTEVRELFLGNLDPALGVVSWCAAYAELKKNLGLIYSGRKKILSVCPALREYINPIVGTPEIATSFLIQNLRHVGKLVSTTLGIDARTLVQRTTRGTAVAGFAVALKPLEHFWNTLLRCAGLINPVCTWTELIMTDIMNPETYESLLPRLICGIKETYDIFQSGNKFCYQAGNYIVSNCQYGMGHKKFLSQCHKKGMTSVTPEIAKKAVYAYRKAHWPIPELWKKLEISIVQAIRNPGTRYAHNKVTIYVHGQFLNIKLPSGRRLRYFKPRVSQKQLAGGRLVPQIHYWAMEHHQWCEVTAWGGIFTNHIVQGIARDLMVAGIFNIEEAGYQFLLSVHDEGLSEHKKGCGNLKEYIELMAGKLPGWADGAPITAEGWVGPRYKK